MILFNDKEDLINIESISTNINHFAISEEVANGASKVFKLVHTWTIDNFTYFYNTENEIKLPFAQSDHFYSPFNSHHKFYLKLYPQSRGSLSEDFITLATFHITDGINSVSVHERVTILDGDEEECWSRGKQD